MKKQFDTERKLYTLVILVQDVPGVLSQVARLFSRKGYNIESIVSGETDKPDITRITIVLLADGLMISQIAAQCSKLLPVQAVKILDEATSIQREFALIKVKAEDRNKRDEVIQISNIFRANIIDVAVNSITLSVIGAESKTDAMEKLLREYEILELVRTGVIALERGQETIKDETKEKGEFDYGKNVL